MSFMAASMLSPVPRLIPFEKRRSRRKRTTKKLKSSAPLAKHKDKPTFPFLELPAELRNKIYEYCLVEPEDLTLVSKTKDYRRLAVRGQFRNMTNKSFYSRRRARRRVAKADDGEEEHHQELRPALLGVNRQVYGEAGMYLYGQTIHAEDTKTLHTFISSIGTGGRQKLREVVVHEWGQGRSTHKSMNHAGLTALYGCTNLERVTLDCRISDHLDSAAKVARQMYRDGFLWMEAVGSYKGKFDAVLDIVELHESNFGLHECSKSHSEDEVKKNKDDVERNKDLYRKEVRRLLSGGKDE